MRNGHIQRVCPPLLNLHPKNQMNKIYSSILPLCSLISMVNGHALLINPKAYTSGGGDVTAYAAEIAGADVFPGYKPYDGWGDVQGNAKSFKKFYDESNKYNSVKEIADLKVNGCGFTDPNGGPAIDVSNLKVLQLENQFAGSGLTPSHTGPCEAWIDNKVVFHNDDCSTNFPGRPATIPMDYSSCKGECTLTFYWLALQNPDAAGGIQIYKYCVPISNGEGGSGEVLVEESSAASADNPAPAENPAPAPAQAPAPVQAPAPAPAPASAPANNNNGNGGNLENLKSILEQLSRLIDDGLKSLDNGNGGNLENLKSILEQLSRLIDDGLKSLDNGSRKLRA